jgi:DNA-binding response OmpR family regulator
MKNITINLIGQRVLASILGEHKNLLNFDFVNFVNLDNFSEFLDKTNKDTNNIIITDISNSKIINQHINQSNQGVIYLSDRNKNLLNHQVTNNQSVINYPLSLFNLIEKINLLYLKDEFSNKSKIKILEYTINMNTREILKDQKKLKLTEREIDLLIFLNSSKEPQSIKNILELVWKYSTEMETHTVETHVHRLRKKIVDMFHDQNFIKSNKKGYYI